MADKTEGSIVIDAPIEKVMETIADFETYPDWIGQMKRVEIRDYDDQKRGKHVFMSVDAGFVKAEYTLEYTYLPGGTGLSWQSKEASGAVRDISGEYVLESVDDGTKVIYRAALTLGIPLPGFLKRQGEKQMIETALKDLKRRVES